MVTKFTEAKTLLDLFKYIATTHKSESSFNYIHHDEWRALSTKDFVKKTLAVAKYLRSIGVTHKSKVAIFAKSSPFWLIYDFAIQLNGAISVPMFTNISNENLKFQIENSGVKFAFVDGGDNWQEIKKFANDFDKIITHSLKVKGAKFVCLNKIIDDPANSKLTISSFKKVIHPDDIATIIYTSGSTGNPKGVCLTHQNLISQVKAANKLFSLNHDDTALSFLPLAHIFERMVMLLYMMRDVKIYFADDINNVQNLLQEIKPTVVTTVPRLLEKIYLKIRDKILSASFAKKYLALIALKYALAAPTDWSKNTPIWKFFNKILYAKIIGLLGGNIRIMISGGAPLSIDTNRFFFNIGLPLYQGYGLTETSPVISVNYPKATKFASSGKTLPLVNVKIEPDGEILVKGPNIMQGYYKDKQETQQVMEDGWLKTGDLGYVDKDGYLFINGRKKELMKTSNGKYVSPINIEAKLKNIPYVEMSMAVADGLKFVSAIIFPDLLSLKAKKIKLKKYHLMVAKEIEIINKDLNHWEKVQKFIIAKELPSVENNQLTPSMKIRRHIILEFYKKPIIHLYK
ncbi:MAG: long-chain fatty acid--CoA ligase [Rickettsiales bacterium]|nr:long-chain fatty acid--CoA ligase [Rickettsiales bacterium]